MAPPTGETRKACEAQHPRCPSRWFCRTVFVQTASDEGERQEREFRTVKGTLIQASPLPLSKWFQAVRLMAESSGTVKATELQRALGVTYVTASRMKKKVKAIMPREWQPTFTRLLHLCINVESKSSERSASR